MTITCPACNYENPNGSEFCEACGSELSSAPVEAPLPSIQVQTYATTIQSYSNDVIEIHPPIPQPTQPTYPNPTPTPINVATPSISVDTARLISKQINSSVSEFPLDGSNAVVGRFDPDSGPVDVDLEGFSGDEMISRNHAEIYREGNQWRVQDIGSTNGVFIKRSNQTRFGARITVPETLNSGDEIAFGKIRFLFQSP